MGVRPGAEPFAADGGEVGAVPGHGATGTSRSPRPWAREPAAAARRARARTTTTTAGS